VEFFDPREAANSDPVLVARPMKQLARAALRRLTGKGPRRPAAHYVQAILGGNRMVAADVGGAEGIPGHWRVFDGSVFFYVFEPHPASLARLQASYAAGPHPALYCVLGDALSGSGGPRTFYRTNEPTGSSILAPNKAVIGPYAGETYFFPCSESTIETRRLENVLAERGELVLDLIKLDIQGAELEVLRGLGESRLNSLLLAEAEVGLHGAYQGQGTFGEIDALLRDHGMNCYDVRIARTHLRRNGRIDGYQKEIFDVFDNSPTLSARAWEFDVVYLRSLDSVLAAKDPSTVRKSIVAYCGYNFFAEGYELAERAEQLKFISSGEAEQIRQTIVAWHGDLSRRFYDAPRPFFDSVRRFLARRHWGQLSRWSQYLWTEYPNS
jgi:FkbM family methyltransferase